MMQIDRLSTINKSNQNIVCRECINIHSWIKRQRTASRGSVNDLHMSTLRLPDPINIFSANVKDIDLALKLADASPGIGRTFIIISDYLHVLHGH